jgi:hypothetical protein
MNVSLDEKRAQLRELMKSAHIASDEFYKEVKDTGIMDGTSPAYLLFTERYNAYKDFIRDNFDELEE